MLSSSQFLKVSRDRLFYDRYLYGMSFFFADSGRMRSLDHNSIKNSVAWVQKHRHWLPHRKPISNQYLKLMLNLSDTISAIDRPFKRVVFSDSQHIYTNDPEIFAPIAQMPAVQNVQYSQAVLDRPRDQVILVHSDYQWRTWFKERVYNQTQRQLLANFILNRPQQYRITPLFRERLSRAGYISRNCFVDHHDQHDIVLLNMVLPGCMRKTLPITSTE